MKVLNYMKAIMASRNDTDKCGDTDDGWRTVRRSNVRRARGVRTHNPRAAPLSPETQSVFQVVERVTASNTVRSACSFDDMFVHAVRTHGATRGDNGTKRTQWGFASTSARTVFTYNHYVLRTLAQHDSAIAEFDGALRAIIHTLYARMSHRGGLTFLSVVREYTRWAAGHLRRTPDRHQPGAGNDSPRILTSPFPVHFMMRPGFGAGRRQGDRVERVVFPRLRYWALFVCAAELWRTLVDVPLFSRADAFVPLNTPMPAKGVTKL
jgi:hypothetical protein